MNDGFGFIRGDQFTFHPNIVQDVRASPPMTKTFLSYGVQFPKFVEVREMNDKFKDPPVKQKNKYG